MDEKWKNWINAKCAELDKYLEITSPQTDANWNDAVSFIKIHTTIAGEYADEVRSALFKITTKWEKKQNG